MSSQLHRAVTRGTQVGGLPSQQSWEPRHLHAVCTQPYWDSDESVAAIQQYYWWRCLANGIQASNFYVPRFPTVFCDATFYESSLCWIAHIEWLQVWETEGMISHLGVCNHWTRLLDSNVNLLNNICHNSLAYGVVCCTIHYHHHHHRNRLFYSVVLSELHWDIS